MKRALLLSALSITLLSSCSTAFKSGQTPDDVYYSPGREIAAAKEDEIREKDQSAYQEYISSQDDRYLRMKVANRSRWNALDDYDYWYDSRYDFSNYNNYASYVPFNFCYERNFGYYNRPYNGYGGYSKMPFYTVISYSSPKYSGGYTSGSNISAYRNKSYSNSNYGYKDPKSGNFISTSNSSNFGNLLKRVFSSGSSSNGNSSSFDRPARTFSTTPTTPTNNTSTTPSTSSSAGGHSGGYSSTGSSTSTGRGGRG